MRNRPRQSLSRFPRCCASNFPAVVASLSVSDEIYIGGSRYFPARDIARTHGYVRDYVARLYRQGKVAGR
jgi:hypothetical protein